MPATIDFVPDETQDQELQASEAPPIDFQPSSPPPSSASLDFRPTSPPQPIDPNAVQAEKNYQFASQRKNRLKQSGAWEKMDPVQKYMLEPVDPDQSELSKFANAFGVIIKNAPRMLGKAVGLAGKSLEAVAGQAAGTGDTLEDVGQSVMTGKPLPVEESAGKLTGATGIAARAGLGIAESLPKIGMLAAFPESLLAQSITAGGLFGLNAQGDFDPKAAVIGALLPGAGALAHKAVGAGIAKAIESGLTALKNPYAQKVIEELGSQAAMDAVMLAGDSPELIQLYRTDKEAFKGRVAELVGGNLAWALLGIRKWKGAVPSETERFISKSGEKYAVQAVDMIDRGRGLPGNKFAKPAPGEEPIQKSPFGGYQGGTGRLTDKGTVIDVPFGRSPRPPTESPEDIPPQPDILTPANLAPRRIPLIRPPTPTIQPQGDQQNATTQGQIQPEIQPPRTEARGPIPANQPEVRQEDRETPDDRNRVQAAAQGQAPPEVPPDVTAAQAFAKSKGYDFKEVGQSTEGMPPEMAKLVVPVWQFANLDKASPEYGIQFSVKAGSTPDQIAEAHAAKLKQFANPGIEPPSSETQTVLANEVPRQVPADQIVTRPETMQFKRIDDSTTGENAGEKLSGKWDPYKGGNLLLWEPKDPAAHRLTGSQKYIVANGHHRFSLQILREADGYSAEDARRIAAEINIADGKGTIYDQVKYLRNSGAARTPDEEMGARARVGARGRQAAVIAFDASDDLYASFINEKVTADQAEAIAAAAPKNTEAQRIGIKYALEGKSASSVAALVKRATEKSGGKAEALDLFGADDSVMNKMAEDQDKAEAQKKDLRLRLASISGASKNPEVAAKEGVDVRDPAAVAQRVEQLRAELERWDEWWKHPDLVRRISGKAESPVIEEPPKKETPPKTEPKPQGPTGPPNKPTTKESPPSDVTPGQQAAIDAAKAKFAGNAPEGARVREFVKRNGRWYRLDAEGSPGKIPSNSKQHAQLEAEAAAPPLPPDNRTPVQILRQAKLVKITAPEGATFIRITDANGRKSVQPLTEFRASNPFNGVPDVVKIEVGTKSGKTGDFVPMAGEPKIQDATPRKLATGLATKPDAVLLGKPIELTTPADIREAILNPRLNITNTHRIVLAKLLDTGILEKLPGLKFEITDFIHGGASGEYLDSSNLARFLRWTDADVPVHEFWHHVHRFLSEDDLATLRKMRLAEVDRLAPQMGEQFRAGIESDEFYRRGINNDLYHLSNEYEFFAWLMTEKTMREFNAPEAKTFVQKVRGIVRDLWNGFKDAFGFSKYDDVLWRQMMNGTYEYNVTDGRKFSESLNDRKLSLAKTDKEVATQMMNFEGMSESQKKELAADLEFQNRYAEDLAQRIIPANTRPGVLAKMARSFRNRLEAIVTARGLAGPENTRSDIRTFDQLMSDQALPDETKQIIAGDLVRNLLDFRSSAENTVVLSDRKIEEYQDKIRRFTADLNVERDRRRIVEREARLIISDYQNRFIARMREAGQAGEMGAVGETIRALEELKQSPEVIGRVIDQIAATVPVEVLVDPNTTAQDLIRSLIDTNGGTAETLATAMGQSGRGVARDMLLTAVRIMQESDRLGEIVQTARATLNPQDAAAVQAFATELRQAAQRGVRSEIRAFVRDVGDVAQTREVVRNAIGKLQPRLRRAMRQLEEWSQTQDILLAATRDPALKALEEKAYGHFDVRSVVVTQGGDHEFTFRNPLTNEEVKIFPSLEQASNAENYAKLQKLFEDAQEYLSAPDDPNYDPRVGRAWRYMIENTQQFWLNPTMNVFVPHLTPFQFDLPAFLSDPWKVLRTNAGLEANDAQVKSNAMNKAKKMVRELETKEGSKVQLANKKAAREAGMSLDDWYSSVFSEIAFRNQFLGQVPPKIGETLLSGHRVTAADLDAARAQFSYLRKMRDIAENAGDFAASRISPARVVTAGISRQAVPTGPITLPGKRSGKAALWLQKWNVLQKPSARLQWLNQPDNFENIVMAHLKSFQTPEYVASSRWRAEYRDIVDAFQGDEPPESIQDIAEKLFETQPLLENGERASTREDIVGDIYGEIERAFQNFDREGKAAESEKPDPIIDVISAENAFTRPRSEKLGAPFTFYDYGVKDYGARLRAGNDSYAWYSLEFVNSLRRLQSALNTRIADLTRRVKEGVTTPKDIKAAARRGDEFFDLGELKLNRDRIRKLLTQQTRVLQSSKAGRSSLEAVFYRVQSAIGAHILMTPGARATHTFGMMGVSGVFNALVENRIVRPQLAAWGRFLGTFVKDVARIPAIPFRNETLQAVRDSVPLARHYAEMVLNRREQLERLKELGVVPESDVRGALDIFFADWKNVVSRAGNETTGTRLARAIGSSADLHNAAMLAWSPQRYNDLPLNSDTREVRSGLVRQLQEAALKHLRNRSDVLGTGYSDFSRPENVLSAQEITGRRGSMGEREAFEKRRLFKMLGLDLDHIMLRYFRNVDSERANGRDPSAVPFLTLSEEASLDFQIAEDRGLATAGTRNLAAQGSMSRRALGYIHGLPLSTMGKFMGTMNRLSNQSNAGYLRATVPLVLMAGAYTTLMGLMRIQSTTALNRAFFNQSSAIPTIAQAKTPDDWMRLLLRAQAGWWPFIGDMINGIILRTPDRFGHLDSAFVMWNFMNDVLNMAGDMWHTKDISGPGEKFLERWVPITKVLTRRMASQAGIREHYNAVADIQSAIPTTMETAAAKFRGGLQPTATTPLTHRALNAMYQGDWATFDAVAAEYAAKKLAMGIKDGESSFKHSISAHNPWIERLGKLPTEEERAQILSRMTPEQRAEVEKAENVFRAFGDRYGTRISFTAQEAEAGKAPSGGGSAGTAGGAGAGLAPLPSVRRISLGGSGGGLPHLPGAGRSGGAMRSRLGSSLKKPRRLVVGTLKGRSGGRGRLRLHRGHSTRRRKLSYA